MYPATVNHFTSVAHIWNLRAARNSLNPSYLQLHERIWRHLQLRVCEEWWSTTTEEVGLFEQARIDVVPDWFKKGAMALDSKLQKVSSTILARFRSSVAKQIQSDRIILWCEHTDRFAGVGPEHYFREVKPENAGLSMAHLVNKQIRHDVTYRMCPNYIINPEFSAAVPDVSYGDLSKGFRVMTKSRVEAAVSSLSSSPTPAETTHIQFASGVAASR